MGLKYCKTCRKAYPEEDTVFFEDSYFCTKCQQPTEDIGAEEGQVSSKEKIKEYDAKFETKAKVDLKGRVKTFETPQIDTIIFECEDVLKNNPTNAEAHFTLGKLYYTKGEKEKAHFHLLKTIEYDPDHGEAQRFLAKKYSVDKDSKAILEASPEDIEELYELAKVYREQGKNQKAKEVLLRLVELDAHHPGSRCILSEIFFEEENYKQTIANLNILKLMNSKDYHIDYNMGLACYFDKNYKRARACFEKAYEKCDDPELNKELEERLRELNELLGN